MDNDYQTGIQQNELDVLQKLNQSLLRQNEKYRDALWKYANVTLDEFDRVLDGGAYARKVLGLTEEDEV